MSQNPSLSVSVLDKSETNVRQKLSQSGKFINYLSFYFSNHMPFYKPLKIEVRKILDVQKTTVIIYPHGDLGSVIDRNERGAIENYVSKLYGLNKLNGLKKLGQYNIAIIWNKGQDIMINIWKYYENESGGSEPLKDVKTCEGLFIKPNSNECAKDSFKLLKIEDKHRVNNTLEDYIKNRPKLPSNLTTGERFYL